MIGKTGTWVIWPVLRSVRDEDDSVGPVLIVSVCGRLSSSMTVKFII